MFRATARLGWLACALFLITLVGAEAIAESRPLRFVTFNLLHGGAWSGLVGNAQDLERRLDMAAEALQALQPDVVGLQEASVGRGRGNVAERLAVRLGFHSVHAQASSRIYGGDTFDRMIAALMNFAEGPAILSRFPIGAWETHELPRCGRFFEPRVLLYAEIDTPWGRFPAFSTHTAGHACHTARVAELVTRRRGSLPAVLMGDLNATEDSAAITILTQGAGFLDAFRIANPTAPGPTVWQRVDVAAPMARHRVDYILVAPGHAFPGRVRESRVVLDAPRPLPDSRVLWPSDHYGVFAEVNIFPPSSHSHGLGRRLSCTIRCIPSIFSASMSR